MSLILAKADDLPVLLIDKGGISEEFRSQITDALLNLQRDINQAMQALDYKVVIGRTLPDLHPRLSHLPQCCGFHAPILKTIFVSEHYVWLGLDKLLKAEDPVGNLYHEIGHVWDLHIAGTGTYPDGCFSLTRAFKEAVDHDLASVSENDLDKLRSIYGDIYYTEDSFQALQRFFQKSFAEDPMEICAESWCQLHGKSAGMDQGFNLLMPACAKIIQSKIQLT